MTFLDWMLESDSDGSLRAQVEADRADRDAGLTWGVYDGPRLVGTHPARYMAEADAADCADAADRPLSDYEVRLISDGES